MIYGNKKVVPPSSCHYLKQKALVIYILVVSCFVTTHVVGDAQLYPIETQDLKSIVDSVKKDVDSHLKMAHAARRAESISFPDLPEIPAGVEDAENGNEYRSFMKMIQDSVHHHLVRNLGQPSDAENDGSSGYIKPTSGSTSTLESASEHFNADDHSKKSSKVSGIRIGSIKGVPGVHFPDYTDIPITSFTCSDKSNLPRFYADLDTGCQVFHVCWPDRRESFLCPMGTTFNQALGVCDYWYNFNCSLAPYYYMNSQLNSALSKAKSESSMINTVLEKTDAATTEKPDSTTYGHVTSDSVMSFISKFLPIKVKIVYPKTATQRLKIVTTASIGENKKPDLKRKPRRKHSYTSKHSRVPRSPEYREPTEDSDTIDLPKFPPGRTLFRLFEALDRALVDIESNETLSKYSEYAKRAVKTIKSYSSYFIGEPLKDFSPEPGSEMYKVDMQQKEEFEEEVWKNMLLIIAVFMEQYHEMETEYLRKHETLKAEPLTNLNERFIIKPAAQKPGHENKELPTHLNRVKRSSTISNPSKLSHEDSLNIRPETKKLLLKNYKKLFKTKHKHA